MSFDDVLLYIDCYPEATSAEAIDQAVKFVALLGGKLSALAVQIGIPLRARLEIRYRGSFWMSTRRCHLGNPRILAKFLTHDGLASGGMTNFQTDS